LNVYYIDATNKALSGFMVLRKRTKGSNNVFFAFLHRNIPVPTVLLGGTLVMLLTVSLFYPFGLALAQTNSWEVTINFNTTLTKSVSGAQVTVTESGSGTLQFNVINQQISGTGSDNFVASLSGTFNQEGETQSLTASPLNVAETYEVTGIVSVNGTATLHVTLLTTNAPSTIPATITMNADGQTLSQTVDIPMELAPATTGSFQIKLENGFTRTVPVSSIGIQGQITLTVHQGDSPLQSLTPSSQPSSTASPSQAIHDGAGISEISGNVQVTRANSGQVEAVSMSTIVHNGDNIKTDSNGYVTLLFSDGSIIKLGPDSELHFGVTSDSNQPKIIQIIYGSIYFRELVQFIHRFNVRTPTCAVAVRGTEFTVEVRRDNSTVIIVFDGEVNVSKIETDESALLTTGESLIISQNSRESSQLSQSVQAVDLSSVDRWWDNSASQNSGFGILNIALVTVVVAIVALAILGIVFWRRRKRNAAGLPLPPPPPPEQ
jgi:hypothetical protein